MFKLKEYIETTNSILRIKDDSRQFLSYKFEYDDIIRLYLYKAFYPSVFDYDIVQANGNENIVFKSSYIKENIGVIQQQIEILLWTISYDAIAIAISNQAYEQISSSKRYNATIRCDITANEIKEDIEVEVKTPRKKIPSIKLIKFFVPSIVYGAKYHSRLYKNKDTNKEKPEKKIVSIFTKFSNIYGIKSDAINTALKKRDVLADAYNDCKTVINSADKFTRILNMYYINSWSHLFDLNIMQTNRDFKPYMIDGIVTKYHINDMIEDNSKKINDTVSASESNFNLKSIYNNPNCIIENFSLRDYEIIDFLITRSAKTISSYYFQMKMVSLLHLQI